VLVAPADLDETALAGAVERGWGIGVASMGYLAVGWGSHHWKVAGTDGAAWFVTVDELENKRVSDRESLDDGFARLRAALGSAVALRNAGREFVVAPVPARGEPAVRFGGRFAVAVYPFTEGCSYGWGEWTGERRSAALEMVAAVHTAPAAVRRQALADDFAVPFRDQMEAACSGADEPEGGPYARDVTRLLREHATGIRRLLDRYDRLVVAARALPGRNVLTHGEPHPGNVMHTGDGWRLIDWDTAAIAPPERDLWHLDPDGTVDLDGTVDPDGPLLDAYAAMTGVTPLPELIGLYRLGWDIKDMAVDVARFLRPHGGDADDAESWRLLESLVARTAG
jgi:Phosphotransferase enzyme family